jgi:putative NADPH-quinone reductase
MRIQLIYAHPAEGSFCSILRDVAQDALRRSGHHLHLTNLYAEGFRPRSARRND